MVHVGRPSRPFWLPTSSLQISIKSIGRRVASFFHLIPTSPLTKDLMFALMHDVPSQFNHCKISIHRYWCRVDVEKRPAANLYAVSHTYTVYKLSYISEHGTRVRRSDVLTRNSFDRIIRALTNRSSSCQTPKFITHDTIFRTILGNSNQRRSRSRFSIISPGPWNSNCSWSGDQVKVRVKGVPPTLASQGVP